jgi:hypothetical protein
MSERISNMPPTILKRLIISSILYTVFALIGAVIAIMENRPAVTVGMCRTGDVHAKFIFNT